MATICHRVVPHTYEIDAKTKAEAEDKYKQFAHDGFWEKKGPNYQGMRNIVEYIFMDDVVDASSITANL